MYTVHQSNNKFPTFGQPLEFLICFEGTSRNEGLDLRNVGSNCISNCLLICLAFVAQHKLYDRGIKNILIS